MCMYVCMYVYIYIHIYEEDQLPDHVRNEEALLRVNNICYIYYTLFIYYIMYKKVKAVPLQTWSGPEGSRKLRFPEFLTTA
jgi:hypothetical protein